MIEDDSEEEVTLRLTKREIAMLFDQARMCRSGWEDFAKEDESRPVLEGYEKHSAERAAAWARVEEKLSEAIGGNPGLKRQKKLLGIRRL